MLFIIYVVDDELCLVTGGASQKHLLVYMLTAHPPRHRESREDLKHARACLGNGPESVGDVVQVEFLNLLTRRRTESLEDLRHVINATRHRT